MDSLDAITEALLGRTLGCGTLALLAAGITMAGVLVARWSGASPLLGALGAWVLMFLLYKVLTSEPGDGGE